MLSDSLKADSFSEGILNDAISHPSAALLHLEASIMASLSFRHVLAQTGSVGALKVSYDPTPGPLSSNPAWYLRNTSAIQTNTNSISNIRTFWRISTMR